jgi:hypothetical protein
MGVSPYRHPLPLLVLRFLFQCAIRAIHPVLQIHSLVRIAIFHNLHDDFSRSVHLLPRRDQDLISLSVTVRVLCTSVGKALRPHQQGRWLSRGTEWYARGFRSIPSRVPLPVFGDGLFLDRLSTQCAVSIPVTMTSVEFWRFSRYHDDKVCRSLLKAEQSEESGAY